MTRMSHAIYNNQKNNPVCAIDIDSEYHMYEDNRDRFNCIFCDVQIQFSRGKDHNDPHFKNWPLTNHKSFCIVPNIERQKEKYSNPGDIELLVSTILPRAQRLNDSRNKIEINRLNKAKVYEGKRSKKFIYGLVNLLDNKNHYKLKNEYKSLELLIEDGTKIMLKDLFGTQDEIIERVSTANENRIICILKGNTRKAQKIKNSIKIPLTKGKNPLYKNSKDFSLFIKWDYVEKNKDFIKDIENALIVCYGEAVINDYGTEIEVFSIKNQIVVLRKYDK